MGTHHENLKALRLMVSLCGENTFTFTNTWIHLHLFERAVLNFGHTLHMLQFLPRQQETAPVSMDRPTWYTAIHWPFTEVRCGLSSWPCAHSVIVKIPSQRWPNSRLSMCVSTTPSAFDRILSSHSGETITHNYPTAPPENPAAVPESLFSVAVLLRRLITGFQHLTGAN